MDGRITIAMNIYRDICLIHKPGGAPLEPRLISQYFQNILKKIEWRRGVEGWLFFVIHII